MNLLIISDIHGSIHPLEEILSYHHESKFDFILLVGDYLNHGPRNKIPSDYNPIEVAERLNKITERVVAVRGNCDSEVDQMLLNFPMMSDFHWIAGERTIFLTHGHLFHKGDHPLLKEHDIFISGHTHLPVIETANGITYFNPGSISIPKGNHPPTYGIITEKSISIFTTEHKLYMEEIKNV